VQKHAITGVGSCPRWTQGGVTCAAKRTRGGSGTRSILTAVRCSRLSLGDSKHDTVLVQRTALWEPGGITRFSTDGWGAEERHLDAEQDAVGEANTQNMESTHIHRRTRIKRLVRRMVCFSQTAHLHAVVLGRFINRCACGCSL
jgi:insertion element IS1 protein InsB